MSDARTILTSDTVIQLGIDDDLQVAISNTVDHYDLAGYNITIKSYPNRMYVSTIHLYGGVVGRGSIAIDLSSSIVSVTNGNAIDTIGSFSYYAIKNGTLRTIGSGYCLLVQVPGYVYADNLTLTGCASGGMAGASSGGVLQYGTRLTVSGPMPWVIGGTSGGVFYGTDSPTVVTFVGSPAISYWALGYGNGLIQTLNWSYTGAINPNMTSCIMVANSAIVVLSYPLPGNGQCNEKY